MTRRLTRRTDQYSSGRRITPPISDGGSTNNSRPLFGLSLVQREFDVPDCSEAFRADVLAGLRERSQLSWAQLDTTPHRGLGAERIPRTQIKAPIPPAVTEDVEKFVVFRIGNPGRVIGFRTGATFEAVWLDERHAVYEG